MRLLVVDDHASHRELLRLTLGQLGEVTLASDGDEALERLQRGPAVDVVVSDWQMPRLDGLELVAAVRGDPSLAALPIVIVSSLGHDAAIAEAFERGATHFGRKPLRFDVLERTVRDAMAVACVRRERSCLDGELPLRASAALALAHGARLTGRLEVEAAVGRGSLALSAGEAVAASFAGSGSEARGEAALLGLVALESGRVRFQRGEGASAGPGLLRPTGALLVDALEQSYVRRVPVFTGVAKKESSCS
jgi:CheY-like chemotaxis protein